MNLTIQYNPKQLSRFWSHVLKSPNPEHCWIWDGSRQTNGYGRVAIDGVYVLAHRFSYLVAKGSLDPTLAIDHLCRTRLCVNPEHLEEVTTAENNRRMQSKTHCKRGHKFTKDNTRISVSGGRICKLCDALRTRKSYAKKNGATGVTPSTATNDRQS